MKFTEKLKSRISRHPLGKAFLQQYSFKTLVLGVASLILSIVFAVINGVIGVLEKSVWYGALAAYYITLIIFRGGVMTADRVCKLKSSDYAKAQNNIFLASGAFLVIIEIAMAAAVTQMVIYGTPTARGEIMAIANAAYAFTKISFAVYNLVKAKKYADPVSRSLRCLNFADACMSMVSLTVVLLTTFSTEESDMDIYMKASVGFAACAIVLALATYMIITSVKNKKINMPPAAVASRKENKVSANGEATENLQFAEAEDVNKSASGFQNGETAENFQSHEEDNSDSVE